ncbi:MAG: PEGA domain-containing protein [Proteobacteria bacterium]|nr:PEGA domain-containing protein [Cystobacterineae bacterium]MCL2258721.1 PEGA domain-containing protein [Cystobacterineae bacterium]MCL2314895.1 PEGA domain-containing protein [Pseudomonadota bacterium]
MRPYLFVVCLFGWLAQAQAQELELDLSDEPPSSSSRFAPSLAFTGIHPVGNRQAERAKHLNAEFQRELTAATQAGRFSRLLGPQEVLPALKTLQKTPSECKDKACLESLAATLGVDRVLSGALTPSGPGSLLTLWGYDSTMAQPTTETAESPEREQKQQTSGFTGLVKPSKTKTEAEFLARARSAFHRMTATLDAGLGKLVVDAVESSAQVSLSGKEIGRGSFETLLERGRYSLLAEAEGFLPFNTEVHIQPNKVELVKVLLVAKPLDKPFSSRAWKSPDPDRKNKPIYARPGFYVALAGLAAMGTGVYFGLTAKSIEKRAVDENKNNILGITRKEANQAKLYALLANILVGGGGAMVAGGTIWMFVAPGKVAENPLDDVDGQIGVVMGIGGTF